MLSFIMYLVSNIILVPVFVIGVLCFATNLFFFFLRGRTGLVVRASDSGSGDLGSILGRVGVLFP